MGVSSKNLIRRNASAGVIDCSEFILGELDVDLSFRELLSEVRLRIE